MFEALVLICLNGDMKQQCMEAADTYGPYKTEDECRERVAKMVYDLSMMGSLYLPAGTQCRLLKETGEAA